jgi:hypothetical protein
LESPRALNHRKNHRRQAQKSLASGTPIFTFANRRNGVTEENRIKVFQLPVDSVISGICRSSYLVAPTVVALRNRDPAVTGGLFYQTKAKEQK